MLGGAVVVVVAVVLLPDRLGLDRWLPFAAFSAFRPALLVVAVVGLALAVATRRARVTTGLVALVVLAAAVPVVARAVTDPAPPDPTPPPDASAAVELDVLTLNVYQGRADPDALAAVVVRERPDLVVLPEAGERYRALMAARLPGYRSWTNVPPQARDVRGIVVLAAARAGDVRVERRAEGTRYPWVEVTGGRLGATRLIGVHLVSPVPGWIAHWPGELASLQRWCDADEPALIVGDLNATTDHGPFRAGTAGCTDTAVGVGPALTATWPTRLPRWLGARIDHVLAANGPTAQSAQIIDVPGTDHRGVLVGLRL